MQLLKFWERKTSCLGFMLQALLLMNHEVFVFDSSLCNIVAIWVIIVFWLWSWLVLSVTYCYDSFTVIFLLLFYVTLFVVFLFLNICFWFLQLCLTMLIRQRLNDLMESKRSKKSSSSKSLFYEAPLGYSIEDIRPNGGIKKFRSAAYSNVCAILEFNYEYLISKRTKPKETSFLNSLWVIG